MAAKAQFQLFPSPAKDKKNPFKRMSVRETPRNKSPIALEATESPKSEIQTESVIIKIIEDTKTDAIQPRPLGQVNSSKSEPGFTQSARSHKQDEHPPSAINQSLRPESPMQTQQPTQRRQQTPVSPGLPITSMFPQYNHQLPLDQQAYFPKNEDSPDSSQQNSDSSSRTTTTRRVSPSYADAVLVPKTVPASVLNFPVEDLNPRIEYSTPEELLTLWESANGQEVHETLGTFNLRMERVENTTFTFGNPHLPFYTLRAGMNGVSLLRNHPLKQNSGVEVMALSLESPVRRRPPNDGLVTVIFSKLAAMLAVEQAAELARAHTLNPAEAIGIETNAVNRAASQESCRLIWNAPQRRYELQHPSLLHQASSPLLGEDGIPISLVQTAKPGILHITVSPSAESESQQPPIIMVTSPISPNSIQAGEAAATSRMSTQPQPDSDEPLASLDLETMTLSICAGLTTKIIPSLYAIDSLIAAMLAIAITDDATYPVLANTQLYVPGLSSEQAPRKVQQPRQKARRLRDSIISTAQSTTAQSTSNATFKGKYYATFAEREDAEQEDKLMKQIRAEEAKEQRDKKIKKQSSKKDGKEGGFFSLFGSKKSKNNTSDKTKQIVVEEFDMEKYGHFGKGSSREGEELPTVARMLVGVLVFGLQVIVTVLSAGVKCAVWIVVNATRCVTSEKF